MTTPARPQRTPSPGRPSQTPSPGHSPRSVSPEAGSSDNSQAGQTQELHPSLANLSFVKYWGTAYTGTQLWQEGGRDAKKYPQHTEDRANLADLNQRCYDHDKMAKTYGGLLTAMASHIATTAKNRWANFKSVSMLTPAECLQLGEAPSLPRWESSEPDSIVDIPTTYTPEPQREESQPHTVGCRNPWGGQLNTYREEHQGVNDGFAEAYTELTVDGKQNFEDFRRGAKFSSALEINEKYYGNIPPDNEGPQIEGQLDLDEAPTRGGPQNPGIFKHLKDQHEAERTAIAPSAHTEYTRVAELEMTWTPFKLGELLTGVALSFAQNMTNLLTSSFLRPTKPIWRGEDIYEQLCATKCSQVIPFFKDFGVVNLGKYISFKTHDPKSLSPEWVTTLQNSFRLMGKIGLALLSIPVSIGKILFLDIGANILSFTANVLWNAGVLLAPAAWRGLQSIAFVAETLLEIVCAPLYITTRVVGSVFLVAGYLAIGGLAATTWLALTVGNAFYQIAGRLVLGNIIKAAWNHVIAPTIHNAKIAFVHTKAAVKFAWAHLSHFAELTKLYVGKPLYLAAGFVYHRVFVKGLSLAAKGVVGGFQGLVHTFIALTQVFRAVVYIPAREAARAAFKATKWVAKKAWKFTVALTRHVYNGFVFVWNKALAPAWNSGVKPLWNKVLLPGGQHIVWFISKPIIVVFTVIQLATYGAAFVLGSAALGLMLGWDSLSLGVRKQWDSKGPLDALPRRFENRAEQNAQDGVGSGRERSGTRPSTPDSSGSDVTRTMVSIVAS